MTGERLFLPELDGAEIDVAKPARALERDRVFGATHVQIDLVDDALRNAEGGFVLLSKIDRDDDRAIDLGLAESGPQPRPTLRTRRGMCHAYRSISASQATVLAPIEMS